MRTEREKNDERSSGDFQDIGRADVLRDLGVGDVGAAGKMTDPTPKLEDFQDCPDCGARTLRAGCWNEGRRRAEVFLLQDPCPYKFRQRDTWGRLVVHEMELVASLAHSVACPGPQEQAQG